MVLGFEAQLLGLGELSRPEAPEQGLGYWGGASPCPGLAILTASS